jgi:hypothetical protein
MRHWLKSLPVVPLSVLFIFPLAWAQASPPKAELDAHLTLLTEELHEGDQFIVRAEIQNISDHPVLVWRDLNWISSLPSRMEILLEDAAGRQHLVSHAAILDYFELPDLQLENGVLRWRVPLYPRTFLGTHFTLSLGDIPPGKYRLHGRYVVGRPQHKETELERALIASKFSIFQGAVETNSIQVEVLPEKHSRRE